MEVKEEEPRAIRFGYCELGPLTPAATHTPTQRPAVRHYIDYALFGLCATLYLLPFLRLIFIGSDEGTLLEGAVRILHGQVFARDFFEVMGPGTFYILAALFKLFGATFLVARTWLFVTSFGTLLAMYFLSRRMCIRYPLLPPILLMSVYFSTMWPMVNHHVDSNFFALLSVVCMVRWLDVRRNWLLTWAGVLAGATTCILQPKGMLLLLAIVAWLWVEGRRQSAWLCAIALVAVGYMSVVGGTLLYFWRRGALRDLVYVNFVWPSHHYGTLNAIPYATGLHQFWNHWADPLHSALLSTPVAMVLILPFLLIAVLPALVVALGIAHGRESLRPEILLYWFCGWALWLSEIHRLDIAHLTSGSPLLLLLCIHFLVGYSGRAAHWVLQLLATSAGALAVVNLLIVLSAQWVPTRVGDVGMFKPDQAIAFLDQQVAAGSEMFAYPTCPMYYFLSATRNPTRYSLLLYNYNTSSQFHEAIGVLDRRKVRYVLWDTTAQAKAAQYFSAAMFRPAGGLLMEPYLETHYTIVKDVDGLRIMERKEDKDANRRSRRP